MAFSLDDIAIDNFRRYLRINTSHPKPDYHGCKEFLRGMASEIGASFQILELAEGVPTILMTLNGTTPNEKSILLSSHYDVVPVSEEYWEFDPFSATLKPNGDIVGRGAQDMKCVGIAYLEALRRILSKEKQLKRTIHLVFTPDEEIGSPKGAAMLVTCPQFNGLNVGVCLDEGVPNPSDRVPVFCSERSVLWIKVVAVGAAGHGSALIQGTAVEKLISTLSKFADWRREECLKLMDEDGDLGRVCSINCTILEAGKQQNVIPERAEARIDIRVTHLVGLEAVKQRIRNICSEIDGVEFEILNDVVAPSASSTDPSNHFWSIIVDTFNENEIEFDVKIFPGGTDSRFYRALDLPAYGISPFRHTPILLHDHNEYLNSKIFLEGIEFYEKLITNLANQ